MSNYTTLTNVNAIKTDLVELAGTYGELYDMYIDDVRDIETAIELYNKSDAKGLSINSIFSFFMKKFNAIKVQ